MFKILKGLLFVLGAILFYCPAAWAGSYTYDIFTWSAGAWHDFGSGSGVAPENINPNSHGSINLVGPELNDTYGLAFTAGSTTELLISHTFDNHVTEWFRTATVSGGPSNLNPDSVAMSHVGIGPLSETYLYAAVSGERALYVYERTDDGNFTYAGKEQISGGPDSVSLDEIGVEWIGGPYNSSYLYLFDPALQESYGVPGLQVYTWNSGIWQWATSELIYGADGNEDWSNYSILWAGRTAYLSVASGDDGGGIYNGGGINDGGGIYDGGGTNDGGGTEVPEPSSAVLFTLGTGAIALRRRTRTA